MKMNKKITAVVGAIGLAIGGAAGYTLAPQDVVTETVTEEVIVEQPIEVEKEVFIDNGNLDEVMQFLHDNEGDVQFITNDLSDDEVDQIVDRILFINEAKAIALNQTRSNFFDEIDGKYFNGEEFELEDLSRLRVDEDKTVFNTDFDYNDTVVRLTGTLEHDETEYDFRVDVLIKDGEFEDFDNIQIN